MDAIRIELHIGSLCGELLVPALELITVNSWIVNCA